PEILPGIFAGFLIATTLSLDDYIITTFTKPATFETLSTYVFDAYARGGRSADVPALRALSSIIFVVIIAFLIIRNILANKKSKEKTR
ncbi:MAG: ABC transporter permease, partial [Clostridia bacterium]|nr:ABC transporter permease [Clostridia bacterium]